MIGSVRISARADYAVRACVELAARGGERAVSVDSLAAAQGISATFLERIAAGGYRLARPADEVTIADVIRAVDGPLVFVRGARPSDLAYDGSAEPLTTLWVALRASVRSVLEAVTLADLAAGVLPPDVRALADAPEAWSNP